MRKKEKWKVVMESSGGAERTFHDGFSTEREAEDFAAQYDWHYSDENGFDWSLSVKPEYSAIMQHKNGRSHGRDMLRER